MEERILLQQRASIAGKRILVVDDNEVIASTMAMILRSSGFHAVAAFSGRQALHLLETGSFDLLLSDVMMPQMTGIELAVEATSRGYTSRALLMSGISANTDLLESVRKQGNVFEILAKPAYPTDVIAKIEELLTLR